DDQIDRQVYAERSGEFERLEIAAQWHPFAVFAQPLLVDRFEPEKDVGHAKVPPEAKQLLVAQQYIATRLKIELLFDAGSRHRLSEFGAVPFVNKCHIVDDKHPRFADTAQIVDHPVGADQPIAAPIESPGATERAIPRTAARKLDRSAWIEDAKKIFAAM